VASWRNDKISVASIENGKALAKHGVMAASAMAAKWRNGGVSGKWPAKNQQKAYAAMAISWRQAKAKKKEARKRPQS